MIGLYAGIMILLILAACREHDAASVQTSPLDHSHDTRDAIVGVVLFCLGLGIPFFGMIALCAVLYAGR